MDYFFILTLTLQKGIVNTPLKEGRVAPYQMANFNTGLGFAAHAIKMTFSLLKYMQGNNLFAAAFDCQLSWRLTDYKC